ncbi:MAG: putative E3 ubiquitin-protein ligase ipaH4.5 [Chlamydiae bacterium]|nr:putative E3 ubiquitin-protein ligase ipaH4.5 [Chlamydiota bacterium]
MILCPSRLIHSLWQCENKPLAKSKISNRISPTTETFALSSDLSLHRAPSPTYNSAQGGEDPSYSEESAGEPQLGGELTVPCDNDSRWTRLAERIGISTENISSANLSQHVRSVLEERVKDTSGGLPEMDQRIETIRSSDDLQLLEEIAHIRSIFEFYVIILQTSDSKIESADTTSLQSLKNRIEAIHRLEAVKETLGKISALHLYCYQFCVLPDSFGGFLSVTKINLTGNNLSTLPESFVLLPSLTNLNLNSNKFKGFPQTLCKISTLIKLDLSENKIASIAEANDAFPSLTSLDLTSNNLTTLPGSFAKQFPHLLKLFLCGNKIKKLTESFGNLTRLEVLFLEGHSFEAFPDSLESLTSLKILFFNAKREVTIPQSLMEKIPTCMHGTA